MVKVTFKKEDWGVIAEGSSPKWFRIGSNPSFTALFQKKEKDLADKVLEALKHSAKLAKEKLPCAALYADILRAGVAVRRGERHVAELHERWRFRRHLDLRYFRFAVVVVAPPSHHLAPNDRSRNRTASGVPLPR